VAAFTPTTNPRPELGVSAGPEEVVLVASGAYTATASQEFVVLADTEGVEITIVATTGGSPSVVPTVECFDIASQSWVVLLTGAAITATATKLLLISHHAATVTNISATHLVRGLMRVTMTHADTTSITYSISAAGI
jgi:hypothetical protein